jgi:gentisate 1,2-dioxygenase
VTEGRFEDVSGATTPTDVDYWDPVIFKADVIARQVERLASAPPPANGRREALFVHPRSAPPGVGLAPGIRVSLGVLLPREQTAPIRHNSTLVNFCIAGGGRANAGASAISFDTYDVWNTPSYRPYTIENDRDDIQVRLTYSNAALLEKLHVHLVDTVDTVADGGSDVFGDPAGAVKDPDGDSEARTPQPLGTLVLPDGVAQLMRYETLINPAPVHSHVLHWPWRLVKGNLDQLGALGASYVGRRLYLLYNPMTGRTNGTTPSFFATMTLRPPGIVDRPHRHVSAAINYFFSGRGWSRIAGRRYDWSAGDLMLTAPGWAIHHHASAHDTPVYELTIQDQPFHIALESLLWQEDLSRPARLLGQVDGFQTNRDSVALDGRPR